MKLHAVQLCGGGRIFRIVEADGGGGGKEGFKGERKVRAEELVAKSRVEEAPPEDESE